MLYVRAPALGCGIAERNQRPLEDVRVLGLDPLAHGPELRQVLFDYLACQRVADAYWAKRGGRDADHERLRKAFDTY